MVRAIIAAALLIGLSVNAVADVKYGNTKHGAYGSKANAGGSGGFSPPPSGCSTSLVGDQTNSCNAVMFIVLGK